MSGLDQPPISFHVQVNQCSNSRNSGFVIRIWGNLHGDIGLMNQGKLIISFAQFDGIEVPINHRDAVGHRTKNPGSVGGQSRRDISRKMGLIIIIFFLSASSLSVLFEFPPVFEGVGGGT